MGFFPRKKISIDVLASSIATMIDDPSRYIGFEKLFSIYKTNIVLNTQQRREVLICTMFFTNRAVQRASANFSGEQEILNTYHKYIYKKISRFEYEQLQFEKLLIERYEDYFKILSGKEDNPMLQAGKYLMAKIFTATEKSNIVYITGAISAITTGAETIGDFVREALDKFEVVKTD